jgi:hypothetical protein
MPSLGTSKILSLGMPKYAKFKYIEHTKFRYAEICQGWICENIQSLGVSNRVQVRCVETYHV